jgi:hypothetical protein
LPDGRSIGAAAIPLAALGKIRHGTSAAPFRHILLDLMAIVSRIAPTLVLLAALVWIVLPVAVLAAPQASQLEGEACPCCEDASPCCDE